MVSLMIPEIAWLLLSMILPSNAVSFFINGESYCDTYIYGGSNETSSLTVTCPILQAPFLFWNSSVAGPIPSGVTDIQGVNITNAGANLTINAFVPALSGVYTCSDGYSTASSILLTTSNPSLQIVSPQPVKLYSGTQEFKLTMSSYFVQKEGVLQPTPATNITILYYDAYQNSTRVPFTANFTQQCEYEFTLYLGNASIANETTFFIRVDGGNDVTAEASFSVEIIALYLTPLPAQIFALIGDDVAIDCSPSDPVIEVYIVYYPNGVWQPAWQPPVVANNGTYNLSSVTKEQSGTYTCVGQTQDFILTESVNLTVLSEPVAIFFKQQVVVNVSIINTDTNYAALTCVATKGNSRLQWMTSDNTINNYLRIAYLNLPGKNDNGSATVNNSQLEILNSAGTTTLIINDVNKYSISFLYCVSLESGIKAMTLITQANPFVTAHPDLLPEAVIGQSFGMMFVVGFYSKGINNDIQSLGNVTVQCTLSLNSNVVGSKTYNGSLPFTLRYPLQITTKSEGDYTLNVVTTIQIRWFYFISVVRVTVNAAAYLKVIVPSISVMPSPVNVLQGHLATLSCVPSDLRAQIVWEIFNKSLASFTGTINKSGYSYGYNGHSISFYPLLIPASLQELEPLSLPDPSLGLIEPAPLLTPFVSYVRTESSLVFRCSIITGDSQKLSHDIQMNILRGPIQMAVTFSDGSQSTLFNDTTINNDPKNINLVTLNCLALNGQGTPNLQTSNDVIDALLQHEASYQNSNFSVLSTNGSTSIQVNHSMSSYRYLEGYYRCSIRDGSVFVLTIIDDLQYVRSERSPTVSLSLGSIGLLYFQIAFNCYDGLTNPALTEPYFVQILLYTYEGTAFNNTLPSQNSSEILFDTYVVGPTRLVLYINPVKLINAGVYSITAESLSVIASVNITVPTLSVMQSNVNVQQWNTTHITCLPSQADVQIQWTFLNEVLATGFQYTYTINATSIEYEGEYACSVFGDVNEIVEPQIVYVNVIAVCPLTYAAGVIWKATYENQTVLMPCNKADPKFSEVTQMSRQCLPSGEWGVVDFTKCTLQIEVKTPFMMVWSSLLDGVTIQQQSLLMSLTDMNITYSIMNISLSTGFYSMSGSSLFAIFITSNFSEEQLIAIISVASYYGGKHQAALPISISYAIIWPSDPCSCKIHPENIFYLCPGVQSSPCRCTNSTQCECLPPFVGDGQLCTIDSDLDGIPNNPLNCTDSSYCIKDNCPYIFNPPPMGGIQSDVCNTILKDGCTPVNDTVWMLQWPKVPLNFTYVQPCPHGGITHVSGSAYRFCSSTGDWGPTIVTECESYLVRYLADQVLLTNVDMAQSLEVLKYLFIQTQPDTTSTLPLDLRDSAYITTAISNLFVRNLHQNGSIQDTFIFLDVVNNLLHETNLVGWQILQGVDPDASPLLLKSTETYGMYVSSAINTTASLALSRPFIVLLATKIETRSIQGDIVFPDGTGILFENASFLADVASLVIPRAFLLERARTSSSIPVANMIIKNINMFLPNSNGPIFSDPVSILLSSQVSVEDDGFASLALKSRPVSINFRVNYQTNVSTQYQCTFWDFKNSNWSSEGMLLSEINGTNVQCYSNHLTSFAVLLAVKTFPDSKALAVVSYVGCGISMVGLLATIIFFLSFGKQLFEKPHNFVHLNLAIALFLAFLVFVAGIESAKHNEIACKTVAALLQYFWLSAFCWMMCEGVMLYLMLVVVFSSLKKKWWFFLLLGWLTPLVFLFVGLAARIDYYVVRSKDDNAISYCWMSTDKGTIWAFAVPIIIIILINIIFLIMVMVVLCRKGRQSQVYTKNFKNNASTVISMLKATILLLPILGGTWIFGLLSINQYTLVFTWLFTILNSLQGLFIFICYVLRDEKVWGRIKKKYENLSSTNSSGPKTSNKPRTDIMSKTESDMKLSEILEEKTFNVDTRLWY